MYKTYAKKCGDDVACCYKTRPVITIYSFMTSRENGPTMTLAPEDGLPGTCAFFKGPLSHCRGETNIRQAQQAK